MNELNKIQGLWAYASWEQDGRPWTAEQVESLPRILVQGVRFTKLEGDRAVALGSVALDPTRQPKQIDLVYTGGGSAGFTQRGIYELAGDRFKVCADLVGGDRPGEFSTSPGSGRALITYRRIEDRTTVSSGHAI